MSAAAGAAPSAVEIDWALIRSKMMTEEGRAEADKARESFQKRLVSMGSRCGVRVGGFGMRGGTTANRNGLNLICLRLATERPLGINRCARGKRKRSPLDQRLYCCLAAVSFPWQMCGSRRHRLLRCG